jgi:hypothetical protein
LSTTQDCSRMASASILERGFAANRGFLGDITPPYRKPGSPLGSPGLTATRNILQVMLIRLTPHTPMGSVAAPWQDRTVSTACEHHARPIEAKGVSWQRFASPRRPGSRQLWLPGDPELPARLPWFLPTTYHLQHIVWCGVNRISMLQVIVRCWEGQNPRL